MEPLEAIEELIDADKKLNKRTDTGTFLITINFYFISYTKDAAIIYKSIILKMLSRSFKQRN